MKTLSVLLIILILPLSGISKSKYAKKKRNDFYKLAIGPQLGAKAYMAMLDSGEGKLYFGYSIGGMMDMRPIRPLGLTTGIVYNKIIKSIHYYHSPVLLNIYGKENDAVILGPVFYFDSDSEKINFNKTTLGGAIGIKTSGVNLLLHYNPKNPLLSGDLNTINFMLGLGLVIDLRLIII